MHKTNLYIINTFYLSCKRVENIIYVARYTWNIFKYLIAELQY